MDLPSIIIGGKPGYTELAAYPKEDLGRTISVPLSA
jgi:hypothetical protein